MALPYATENQLKLLEQKTKSELDKKTENINLTADTLEDMNKLVTKGSVGDGQLCYCKEDKQIYVFKNNTFRKMIDLNINDKGLIDKIDGRSIQGVKDESGNSKTYIHVIRFNDTSADGIKFNLTLQLPKKEPFNKIAELATYIGKFLSYTQFIPVVAISDGKPHTEVPYGITVSGTSMLKASYSITDNKINLAYGGWVGDDNMTITDNVSELNHE